MAIIGNIGGLPVFDKKEEAITWGKRNGLTGYHTHTVSGKVGYMGGSNHAQAVKVIQSQANTTRISTNNSGGY
jgi:hypothetical protein